MEYKKKNLVIWSSSTVVSVVYVAIFANMDNISHAKIEQWRNFILNFNEQLA